jgi:3-oxoacyl-[acyl-carrier-protein] synthase III
LSSIQEKVGVLVPAHMEIGNVSSATIFYLIHKLIETGEIAKLNEGDLVALTGFGIGLHTRAAIGQVCVRAQ